jgi:hypothetical protein
MEFEIWRTEWIPTRDVVTQQEHDGRWNVDQLLDELTQFRFYLPGRPFRFVGVSVAWVGLPLRESSPD